MNRSPAPPPQQPKAEPDPVREELYRLNSAMLRKFSRLDMESKRFVVDLLEKLSDADAGRIAAYASGLAEWPDPDASSKVA